MKFFVISITSSCTIVLFSQVLIVSCEKSKSCQEFVSGLTKRQIKAIPNCIKILGLKSGHEKTVKKNCILKCALMTEGIFNSEGYMDGQTVIKFIENQAPQKDRDRITQLFFTCTTYANLIDPREENCKVLIFQRKIPAQIKKIEIIGLFIGSRGTISSFFEAFRKRFKLDSSLYHQIALKAIKSSTQILHHHLYSKN